MDRGEQAVLDQYREALIRFYGAQKAQIDVIHCNRNMKDMAYIKVMASRAELKYARYRAKQVVKDSSVLIEIEDEIICKTFNGD